MSNSFVLIRCFIFSSLLTNVICGPFSANWTTTIIDPARPNHRIPLGVSYPITGDSFPVIVFAHGMEGRVRWYDYIYDNMVPNGYVVAMPATEEHLIAHHEILAKDQRYVLDYLVEQNSNRSSPIYNKIGKGYIASGHSMGGESTILAATNYDLNETYNNEFDAMMLLSACAGDDNTLKNALKSMVKPSFIMSGSQDCACNPNTTSVPFYNILNEGNDQCKYLAVIKDGTHCFFCDFSYDYEVQARIDECFIAIPPCSGRKYDFISMTQQINIVNKYMVMFSNSVVNNDSDGYKNVTKTLNNDFNNGVMNVIEANCTL